jgi:hypothetical protein
MFIGKYFVPIDNGRMIDTLLLVDVFLDTCATGHTTGIIADTVEAVLVVYASA